MNGPEHVAVYSSVNRLNIDIVTDNFTAAGIPYALSAYNHVTGVTILVPAGRREEAERFLASLPLSRDVSDAMSEDDPPRKPWGRTVFIIAAVYILLLWFLYRISS